MPISGYVRGLGERTQSRALAEVYSVLERGILDAGMEHMDCGPEMRALSRCSVQLPDLRHALPGGHLF